MNEILYETNVGPSSYFQQVAQENSGANRGIDLAPTALKLGNIVRGGLTAFLAHNCFGTQFAYAFGEK